MVEDGKAHGGGENRGERFGMGRQGGEEPNYGLQALYPVVYF